MKTNLIENIFLMSFFSLKHSWDWLCSLFVITKQKLILFFKILKSEQNILAFKIVDNLPNTKSKIVSQNGVLVSSFMIFGDLGTFHS